MPPRFITKHAFLQAIDCLTKGWFALQEQAGPPPSDGVLLRMQEGQEIHRRARSLHPGGVFAGDKAETQRLMLDDHVTVIFEASFEVDGVAARADWIRRTPAGWVVGEIKSSLYNEDGAKDEHIGDLAYTTMVLRRAGVSIRGCELVLLNRDWRLGAPDDQLFVVTDQTADVESCADEFDMLWDSIRAALLDRDRLGPEWCWTCRGCEHFAVRCVGVGVRDPIFNLPRLNEKKFATLTRNGVRSIHSLPMCFGLTPSQHAVVTAVRTGEPQVDVAGIQHRLGGINWPVGYLDFETVMTALPLYPDVAPHEQVVTQYSLHVREVAGRAPAHHEYLADHGRDSRRELAERLLSDTAACRTVFAYSSFEKTMIRGLARRFPDLAGDLDDLEARLLDLEPVLRRGFVHPDFGGRSSIKVVLPVIAPDMSYAGLAISNGGDAVAAFARLAMGQVDPDAVEAVRTDLLEYCRIDTLAMLRLHGALDAMI